MASAESEEENNSVAESTDKHLEQSKGKNESEIEGENESKNEGKAPEASELWRHPEEEIILRSGQRIQSRVAYDGTEPQAPKRCTRSKVIEVAAAGIKASFVEAMGLLGEQELRNSVPNFRDTAIEKEEFILMALSSKQNKLYRSIKQAFGYRNEKGVAAAALEDFNGEVFLVGATGKNNGNTAELNVMNFKQAMATVDKKEWENAVQVEHEKMKKYNVFQVVHSKDIPKGTKIFDSTWAMKKKPDGTF